MNANRSADEECSTQAQSISAEPPLRRSVRVRTMGGRDIPPPPHSGQPYTALAVDCPALQASWIIDQALAEARFRGDAVAQLRFERFQEKTFTSGDAGECCLYLFGRVFPEFKATTGELLDP